MEVSRSYNSNENVIDRSQDPVKTACGAAIVKSVDKDKSVNDEIKKLCSRYVGENE